jgi:prepilin-type N-terminal cleavage/methylation domain-containing protein
VIGFTLLLSWLYCSMSVCYEDDSLACNKNMRGFTLIELMVTIIIVGLLAAIAIPSYVEYQRKARYSELVNASGAFRKGVDLCYQTTASLTGCTAGQNGVPQNYVGNSSSLTAFIFTLNNGIIFVFPNSINGFNTIGDYYTLTPTIRNGTLRWDFNGPGARYITD